MLSQKDFWESRDYYLKQMLYIIATKSTSEIARHLRYYLDHDDGESKFCIRTIVSDLQEFETLTQNHNELPQDRKTLLRLFAFIHIFEHNFDKAPHWKMMSRYGDKGWELRPAFNKAAISKEDASAQEGTSIMTKQSQFMAGFKDKKEMDLFMQEMGEF